MNQRRTISSIVLATILLAQALPAHAARMLCPMKAEARAQVACTGCEAKEPSASSGMLRSRGCCHMTQGEATDATPVILSASRRGLPSGQHDLLTASIPLLVTAVPDGAVRAVARSAPPGATLLASTSRTTVLRN